MAIQISASPVVQIGNSALPQTVQVVGKIEAAGLGSQGTFAKTFETIRSAAFGDSGGMSLHSELSAFSDKILSGKAVPLADLMVYQIRAGQFGMRVELFSKLADSMLATMRKLQQPQ